jgi:hypothetical protein
VLFTPEKVRRQIFLPSLKTQIKNMERIIVLTLTFLEGHGMLGFAHLVLTIAQ